jgi:hypothetical protein
MSVMLTFGLALSSLSYKQQVLASSALESQYAFYAADTGLECALLADQAGQEVEGPYAYQEPPDLDPTTLWLTCDGVSIPAENPPNRSSNQWALKFVLPLDDDKRCAIVTVYKPNPLDPPDSPATYIFSQGYNVSCDTLDSAQVGARIVTRGVQVRYSSE